MDSQRIGKRGNRCRRRRGGRRRPGRRGHHVRDPRGTVREVAARLVRSRCSSVSTNSRARARVRGTTPAPATPGCASSTTCPTPATRRRPRTSAVSSTSRASSGPSLVEDGDLPAPASFISPRRTWTSSSATATSTICARDSRRCGTYRCSRRWSTPRIPRPSASGRRCSWTDANDAEPMAATRYEGGSDVDFGALTHALVRAMTAAGRGCTCGTRSPLSRGSDGMWTVTGPDRAPRRPLPDQVPVRFRRRRRVRRCKLLQKARDPGGPRLCGLPARRASSFAPATPTWSAGTTRRSTARPQSVPRRCRCRISTGGSSTATLADVRPVRHLQHQAPRARPPRRPVHDRPAPHNIALLLAVGVQNLPLVRYLIGELLASRKRKFAQLRRFYPGADPADWELVQAGQRAQLIKPHPRKIGVLTFGTELVTGADGTIAGLLGASPGASIAPSVMLDLLADLLPGPSRGLGADTAGAHAGRRGRSRRPTPAPSTWTSGAPDGSSAWRDERRGSRRRRRFRSGQPALERHRRLRGGDVDGVHADGDGIRGRGPSP